MDVREAVENARLARQRLPRTIRALMRLYDVTDQEVADAFGFGSRQALNNRLTGRTAIAPEEEEGFARFFGVERHVLYMEPEDAMRWALDHPSDLLNREKP